MENKIRCRFIPRIWFLFLENKNRNQRRMADPSRLAILPNEVKFLILYYLSTDDVINYCVADTKFETEFKSK